jgi:hypothetical protein
MTKDESKPASVWVLLSVANNYDQPAGAFEGWWSRKPTFDMLLDLFAVTTTNEKGVIAIAGLLNGNSVRFPSDDTDYYLSEVPEGSWPTEK